MGYAKRRLTVRTCLECGIVTRWCRWCHRPHCHCVGKRADEVHTTRPKYPKWCPPIIVREAGTGRTVLTTARRHAKYVATQKAFGIDGTLRREGRQNVFTSETGRAAVLKRWKHTRVSTRTGKHLVKLATVVQLAKRKARQPKTGFK